MMAATTPNGAAGKPRAKILDPAGVGAGESQPGLLDDVVRLGERAEHPAGHHPQAVAVLLETLGQPLLSIHRSQSSRSTCHIGRPAKTHQCDWETPMKAVRVRKPEGFEGIDGLVYEDAPDPQPAIGDALVQVRAASFTPTELTWPLRTDRNGHDRVAPIPAHEGSGVVVALGYGAAGVSVGDEVYGLIDGYRDGWAAEYVTIEARSLAPKPTAVDFIQAAAIPQAALTSWQALFDHGHLESGQRVLIHGAGGGVGSTGVQLAHEAGAH